MSNSRADSPQIIPAKWKIDVTAKERYFGSLFLDETFQLRFPILDRADDIPRGTLVLWGISEKLRKCTVRTLPFWSLSSTTNSTRLEQTFSAIGHIRHLLVGDAYVEKPESQCVGEITFCPQPNGQLHFRRLVEAIEPHKDISEIRFSSSCEDRTKSFASALFAYFEAGHDPYFELSVKEIGATITAWIGGRGYFPADAPITGDIMFTLRFDSPRTIESALEETNRFCVFLSFIAHQFTHPERFSVHLVGHAEPFEVHCRDFTRGERSDDAWVRNTLVLPDEDPSQFCSLLARWYETNHARLRSRTLYRYSLRSPNIYSAERYLSIFQVLEGEIGPLRGQLLDPSELEAVAEALQGATTVSGKYDLLIQKIHSSNRESPHSTLIRELPKLFTEANVTPTFDIQEFVRRAYRRRNKDAHGGSYIDPDPFSNLIEDTRLLTAICFLFECLALNLDSRQAFERFRQALTFFELPLALSAASR
jgi:hypothetical protein